MGPKPQRNPSPVEQQPAQRAHDGPMGIDQVRFLGQAIGNQHTTQAIRRSRSDPGPLQRVAVKYLDPGETIYENPSLTTAGGAPIASPTAAQKKFVATPYGGFNNIQYDMTRSGTGVHVKVRILFVDQSRGTNQWLMSGGKFKLDKAGNKLPDPDYSHDVGKEAAITDAARKNFATTRCAKIGSAWDHYTFEGKEKEVFGGLLKNVPVAGDLVKPSPKPIKLPVTFSAVPVFDLAAAHHAKIKLFGMGVDAKRSGAHPFDAGHWYMNTKKYYGGMDMDAILAHEYGHLLGLHDEYSRSNDQMHQMLHLMGGGAKNAHKDLDRHTARQMVAMALRSAVYSSAQANIAATAKNIESAKGLLERQLTTAIRSTWRQAGIRSGLVSRLEPNLASARLKRHARPVVNFETGANLSNRTLAESAIGAFTASAIKTAVLGKVWSWFGDVVGEQFKVKDAGGTETSMSSTFSANVTGYGAGAGKAKATAAAGDIVGTGAGGVPKLPPSPSLLTALEGLPKYWKSPGKGLGTAYTPAVVLPKAQATVDAAVAGGLVKKVSTVGELYKLVYDLVQSAVSKSAQQAVIDFTQSSVEAKVEGQLATVRSAIDTEIDAAMGMTAGGAAVKSKDPNLKALATKLYGMVQASQNPAQWKSKTIISPGAKSAGQDVKYTASTMMGGNNTAKEGFREDMITPVLEQFNGKLRRWNEDDFKVKTR